MVEENEIRLGLSHYERARIVALSADRNVFESERAALRALFGNVSRAKRSKIGSFLTVYRALDAQLRFPHALGERLGLRIAKEISDDRAAARALRKALEQAAAETPEAEQRAIEQALTPPKAAPQPDPAPETVPGHHRGRETQGPRHAGHRHRPARGCGIAPGDPGPGRALAALIPGPGAVRGRPGRLKRQMFRARNASGRRSAQIVTDCRGFRLDSQPALNMLQCGVAGRIVREIVPAKGHWGHAIRG